MDAALLTALRHLPDRQREVIALRVFLDLDIDTIAGQLGIAPGTVRVHLVAFSVVTGPGGDTTLTLYPGQVANPDAVRRALAEHGIPALVTADEFCRTAVQPSPGVGQVVTLLSTGLRPATGGRPHGPTLVIHGAAIPSGVKLSIGYRQHARQREISFSLIQADAPLTCTSLPDTGPHTR